MDRENLKNEITKGLRLRNELISEPTLERCAELMNQAIVIKGLALKMEHHHGILLGDEMAIRSEFEKMVLNEDAESADKLYRRLLVAIKKAEYLGDQDLILRLYETRADYYALTGELIDEIDVC